MRSTRTPRFPSLLAACLALVVLAAATAGEGASPRSEAHDAARWRGLIGGERARVALGQRMIVVLKQPSLAQRVARAGGHATELQMRQWTAAALASQKQLAARLALDGLPLIPELNFTRVLNGFSAPLDPRGLALLERDKDVAGVYPVRPAYPATVTSSALAHAAVGLRANLRLPGRDGTGITIALLDTGVDRTHPFIRDRLLEGIDVLDPEGIAVARQHPQVAGRPERHATELAGLLAGTRGPDGIAGVAPGATILPIRVAGWQQDAGGGYAIYARTDQLIAGLERAVDPNTDGDAHDAARIALVGVAEPFAAFPEGALAQAVQGATDLDTLVVAPAGNDGPGGPSYGSVAGPGGAPAALTVGAADERPTIATARVLLRAGLDVLVDGPLPLAGAVAPDRELTLRLGVPRAPDREQPADTRIFSAFFDRDGYSLVAGKAALVPAGAALQQSQRDAALAGAAAVLLEGVAPAGSLGLDERVDVPVVGIPVAAARAAREAVAHGIDVTLSLGAPGTGRNPHAGGLAAFSSRGLAFAGGVKPEVAAPGIALATSEPGRSDEKTASYGTVNGTSASAAVVAGAAALLAQGRPSLDAAALRGVLVGTAGAPSGTTEGEEGGAVLDLGRAAAAEVVSDPTTVSFGPVGEPESESLRTFTVRNVSTRRLTLRLSAPAPGVEGVTVTVAPKVLRLPRGASAEVKLSARVSFLSRQRGAVEGVILLSPIGGVRVRVPWAVAFPRATAELLDDVRLSQRSFRSSDTAPAVLSLRAGRVDVRRGLAQVLPVELLEVELWRGETRLGRLVRLRDLLPGNYAFGLTGRGPRGGRLASGDYILHVLAVPAGGGEPSVRTVPMRIR